MGVADTLAALLIAPDVWAEIEGDADKAGDCVWGIDLGETAAMCSISGYWEESGRCESIAAFPNEPDLTERERLDGVKPGLYRAMQDRGELLTLGGQVVPVDELLEAATERLDYPARIVCDRWRIGELGDAMTKAALLAPIISRGARLPRRGRRCALVQDGGAYRARGTAAAVASPFRAWRGPTSYRRGGQCQDRKIDGGRKAATRPRR